MKLSHPTAIKFTSLLISWWVCAWMGTMTVRKQWDDPSVDPRVADRPYLYLFWHETLVLPAYTNAHDRVAVLISNHRDGELVAQVVRMLRGISIRGSSTRGGAGAVRAMMRQGKAAHLAITPDGPRGPRRVLQSGAIFVASRAGMPIVPVGIAFEDCWRLRSWDRFAIPRPGRVAQGVVGRPIFVPASADREELEAYRVKAQEAMDEVQGRAERMVEG